MACGPCGAPPGYERKWQHIVDGKISSEHDTQQQANAAKAKFGGNGRVQRVTRKLTR